MTISQEFFFIIKQSCTPKQCRKRLISLNESSKNDAKEGNTIGLLSNRQASKNGPRGNADSKQRLIISHEENFFIFCRKSKTKRTEKYQHNLGSKTQGFHHNRCKNKSSSENRRTFLLQFFTTAMRSSYAFIHARMHFCKHRSLACLRTCPVKESQLCFRTHFRCFKVKLTPCVNSTRATTTLAGLQFLTPRKDVMNRSQSM